MKATTYIFLLLAWATALAQGSLEVIELRHTTAERVLPALRPLLEPGGVLTGQRSQLIVRTSPRNLEELRRALAVLDAPARRLMISVRFDRTDVASDSSVEADARISNRGSRVEATVADSRASGTERVDQRLQVLEGGRAFIAEGTRRPLQMRDGVLIQDIATGFEVVPRVAGSEVILEVAPQRQSPGAAGSVRALGSATTVRARLGEWVALAGIDEASVREERGLTSRSRRGGESSRRIWVKVEEVRP
ncbi:MAG TPA: secretin N-terminal domain-containing protein [Burkholderiales bacterium]|nr:secretin N-terminal domain-containing protein [Burkholderiales bacterium]